MVKNEYLALKGNATLKMYHIENMCFPYFAGFNFIPK